MREGKPFSGGHVVFQPRGAIHMEESLVDGTRAIGLELKNRVTAAPAPAANTDGLHLPPDTYRTLLDNQRVRIIETTLRPGHISPTHAHPGRLVVQLGPCEGARTPASAVTTSGGQRVWWANAQRHGGGVTKLMEVCRYIELEVKAAR